MKLEAILGEKTIPSKQGTIGVFIISSLIKALYDLKYKNGNVIDK